MYSPVYRNPVRLDSVRPFGPTVKHTPRDLRPGTRPAVGGGATPPRRDCRGYSLKVDYCMTLYCKSRHSTV